MTHLVGFEAIETYLHKNVYPSGVMEDKGKEANFSKNCKLFSMLHEELMHNNTRLVISSTEAKHTKISGIHKDQGMIERLKQCLCTIYGVH